ncbi:MAG: ATP synthase F1 subunit gamma [Ruminococcaceae bacterium]|nr:ATP synthase F1 subunit gamma [Oscillospiraceae bacterium]
MASASEIKSRISGIADTKKITDAMYMIASAKMRRALRDLEETTPYFETLAEKIGDLFAYIPETENRYFHVPDHNDTPHKKHGILLITSDKGLAGSYNHAAIEMCEQYMSRHPLTTLFIIGEYGRQYFINKKVDFVEDFRFSATRPNLYDTGRICARLLQYYDDAKVDDINIIYTDYMGAKPGECKKITLLPLERTRFHQGEREAEHIEKEFLPSPEAVLDGVIPSYVMGFIHGSLVESYCSEQQARMNAMKNASDNAEEMLKTLRLQYNKIRQAAITNEMTEITAGAKAQNQKRRRPKAGEYHE